MDKKKVISSPFRWAGSKKKLLNEMLISFDSEKEIYIEPFLGSGIVLLNIINQKSYKRYYVNDINQNIIDFYKEIQMNLLDLIKELKIITHKYNEFSSLKEKERFFYNKRERFNGRNISKLEKSVLFWFLMKTCFNGVYRVNSHNEFNVPFGKKEKIVLDEDYFVKINELIQDVHFMCEPYEKFINQLNEFVNYDDCFIYMDPPYLPETSSTINHILYTKNKFKHMEFIKYLNSIKKTKASIMISMSKSKYGDLLYGAGFHMNSLNEIIRTVNPHRIIKSKEIAYTNYELKIKNKHFIKEV